MSYLGWFDDNPKKSAATKIAEAADAYYDRYGITPNVVLVNEADATADSGGIVVHVQGYIRRNNYWVSWKRNPQSVEGE